MDGTTDKSGRRRATKVERFFELSRMESQIIPAAYEKILPPITRSTTQRKCETNGGSQAQDEQWSQARGA